MRKLKSQNGFTASAAVLAIIIVSVSLGLISVILYNAYSQALATHQNSLATFYIVEILEKVNSMDFFDEDLVAGTKRPTNGYLLDIPIDSNYDVVLTISDYTGNTNRTDLVKQIMVDVQYQENNLTKNVNIETLKLR